MGKVANVFTFPKYVYGRIQPTFCSQLTFIGVVPRGKKWPKLAQFHVMKGIKYKRVENNKNSKMTNNCMLHMTGWEPFWDKGLHCFTPRKVSKPPHQKGLRVKLGVFFYTHPLGPTRSLFYCIVSFGILAYRGKLHILFSTI